MALTEKERIWLDEKFNDLTKEIVKAQIAIAKLQVKSGIWGVIGGCIPVLITIAIYLYCKG